MQTLSVDHLVGQTLGNYRVERLLGKGRLNAVYLARHLPTQRTDALTLYLVPEQFSPEARQRFLVRFLKESAAIATLNHPHVLPIYASGDLQGYPYLVTPYMMHGSLADIVKQKKRCDYPYVQSVLQQVTSGLAFAHSQGFIHGTLKPANIVLQSEDSMQVAGFGLMHMLQISGIEHADQQYAHLLSIAGTFLAAPEYIAPEVVQGKSIDARSDIYAIGCILYELLSGAPPFTGSNPLDVVKLHVTQSLPSLRNACPDLPAAIISVVHQALEHDPQRRFQHANELAEAFSQATRGAQGPVAMVAPPRAPVVERAPEIPRDGSPGSPGGNWQLLPPIVTGKLAAIDIASVRSAGRETPTLVNADAWQVAAPATGQAPTTSKRGPVPAPPTLVNTDAWQMPARSTTGRVPAVQPVNQKAPPAAPPIAPQPIQRELQQAAPMPVDARALPDAQGAAADLAQAYSWWSQPGLASAPPQVKQNRPPTGSSAPAARDALRLPPPPMADWTTDAPMPNMNMQSSQQRPRKLKRRYVVASMVTGVAAVAVAGTAFALKIKQPGGSPQAPAAAVVQNTHPTTQKVQNTQQNGKPANQAQPPAATQPPAAQPKPTTAAVHTGNVVGKTTQGQNTAVAFTNPADNKESYLIHLSNGTFVAYERFCTHEGVPVNYDPATSTLICPAHGAIFDPANGGKVLQGPATTPIAKVTVHVNTDGTVTSV